MKRAHARLPSLPFAAFAAVASLLGCGDREGSPPAAVARANVLLVTLDTTRADALSCYAESAPRTPGLDRLAREGARFERALTAAPMTLPSHATILTGRYPFEHGARDNATFVVPDSETTLAEILQTGGYRTGAVIAAPVLEHSFGLRQGFEHYDDEGLLTTTAKNPERDVNVGRPAADITDRALRWVTGVGSDPFFLWAHYFDPHQPWIAPEPYRSKYQRPYDAEVAYMDEHVGRLIDGARRASGAVPLLVMVVADHGEGLGAHGETSHGLFLYEETMRVPLLITHPAIAPGSVVRGLARTVDLLPTIAELLGISLSAPISGRSLMPLLGGRGRDSAGEPELAYLETMMPYTTFDLSPLFGLSSDRVKFVWAPREELYDLASDPHEERNLAAQQPDRVRTLRERLKTMQAEVQSSAGRVQLERGLQEVMGAIGYAGTVARPVVQEPRGGDPKDHVDVVEGYDRAFVLFRSGKLAEGRDLLRTLVAKNPGSYLLNQLYGTVLGRLGLHRDALAPLRKSIEIEPNQPETLVNLSIATFNTNDRAAAESYLQQALKLQPLHAGATLRLASLYGQTERTEQARALLGSFLDRCGNSPERAQVEQLLRQMGGTRP